MADVLTELVAKIRADASELRAGLADADKSVGSWVHKNERQFKVAGAALTGIGVAITGALGLAGKQAMEAVESENLFTVSLGDNADAARAWSETMGKALGLNTFELRKNVGVMFTMISSMGVVNSAALEMSQGVTQLANDMASFYNLPTEEAFAKLRAGITGETEPLKRLGILVDEATIKQVALTHGIIQQGQELTQTQKVQARYLAIMEQTTAAQGDLARTIDSPTNQLRVLGSRFTELSIIIGQNVLPLISKVTSVVGKAVTVVMDWIQAHPALTQALTIAAAAIGIIATAMGGLLLIAPALTAAIGALGLTATIALGGLPIIIGAVIAAGVLLWQNWDKVTAFMVKAWANIKLAVLTGVDGVLAALEKMLGFIPILGDKIKQARENVRNLIDKERIVKDLTDTQKNLKGLTQTIKSEFEKQAADIKASFDQQKQAARSAYDAAVEAINKEYGIGEAAKDVSETRIDAAKRAAEEAKESYQKETDAAKTRYDSEMDKIRSIYNAKVETLNLETDATIKALQDQIDAIDAQSSREELAITRAEEARRLAELEGVYDSAKTAEERAKAKEEWDKYAADVARRELLRTRDEEKGALRQQIAEARTRADEKREQIKEEETAELDKIKRIFEAETGALKQLEEQSDSKLQATLGRIEQERLAKISAETQKLDTEITRLNDAEKAEVQFYADQLLRANQQVKDINLIYDGLQKRYDIQIIASVTEEMGEPHKTTLPDITGRSHLNIRGFASGGIVPGPLGMPQLAMVHGGEAVMPPDSWGSITINIDSFTANSERDVDNLAEKVVKLIRARTGLR